ncbi:hypothetical protein BGZ97_003647, partial [Linnemannia gamsii]
VAAYAIGGTHGEDLSIFSFAGASVLKMSQLQRFYKMYGKNRTIPLEYDAELYRPKHRLDLTPDNARTRVNLWEEVAAAAWK